MRAHAVGDQRAVLDGQRHDVGDGTERREVGELAPRLRMAEPRADRLHELEGDACARQIAGRTAGRVELGVGDWDADGQAVTRLVVIGDGERDALLGEDERLGGRRRYRSRR